MADRLSLNNPVMSAFAFYAVVVVVKMFFIALLTSVRRSRKAVFTNPEDVAFFYKGKNPDKKPITNDPDVERSRRNHLNDLENIPPFVLIGFLYVLTSPSVEVALWHFRIFAFSRLLHTMCYQLSLQPWRAMCYVTGLAVTLSMCWQVVQATL